MTTAIDSNILIDLIGPTTEFTASAIVALNQARADGAMIICPLVAAEIAGYFESEHQLAKSLQAMEIVSVGFTLGDMHRAGSAYVDYRRRSSRPKNRMLADFLVGAHALSHANILLTRDRGYYRTYFPQLQLAGLGPV